MTQPPRDSQFAKVLVQGNKHPLIFKRDRKHLLIPRIGAQGGNMDSIVTR